MTLYWPDSAGTTNVILTAEIFRIKRTPHDRHLAVHATLLTTSRGSAGVTMPLEFWIDFTSIFTTKMKHNSYFIAFREIYQNICPEVPRNPWDVIQFPTPKASGNITSQGFLGTSGQTFWYISLKAMKYLYNISFLTFITFISSLN